MVTQKKHRTEAGFVREDAVNPYAFLNDFWDQVGIPPRGPLLYKILHAGAPLAVYHNLADLTGIEKTELSQAVSISRSTLKRREAKGRFTVEEGDRLYRFAEVFKAATELFEGDRDKARDWMFKPAKGLGGKRPIDMVATTAESEGVLDLIGRLEYGVVA